MSHRLRKIVSGGQTGVDRAALDVAASHGLPAGGWCPKGRKAEDGIIPEEYPLEETPSPRYPVRTAWNVRDSDGTLILTRGRPSGGTALTHEEAGRRSKPVLVVDLDRDPAPEGVRKWLRVNGIQVLNVAGPRESTQPGIGEAAATFLERVLDQTEGEGEP